MHIHVALCAHILQMFTVGFAFPILKRFVVCITLQELRYIIIQISDQYELLPIDL